MLVFLNCIAIYFAYQYALNYDFKFSFFKIETSLFVLLFTNLMKVICFTPLEKYVEPGEKEIKETEQYLTSINAPEKVDAGSTWFVKKDVWYHHKVYRVRVKCWFLWVPICVLETTALIYYMVTHNGDSKNIFADAFIWLSVFSTYMQTI